MDTSFYLDKFQKAADQLDKKLLNKKRVEAAVVVYGEDCIVLKLYKKVLDKSTSRPIDFCITNFLFSLDKRFNNKRTKDIIQYTRSKAETAKRLFHTK